MGPCGGIRDSSGARGEGLEPSITGPEPVVLPITPPPNGWTIRLAEPAKARFGWLAWDGTLRGPVAAARMRKRGPGRHPLEEAEHGPTQSSDSRSGLPGRGCPTRAGQPCRRVRPFGQGDTFEGTDQWQDGHCRGVGVAQV